MPEVKVNNEAPVAKKLRRGVSNETHAVSQMKFHEKDAGTNGLFIGHLDEVRVDWSVNADGKSFTGMKMPRLTFHFASNHANVNERRHVYQTLFPIESNVDTIPEGSKAWQVDNIFNWIKHMLDVFYLKGREMTDAEIDALTLSFVDYDDEGNYVAVEPEDVLAGYATLFNNVVAIMTGKFNLADGETPKCCYKDANGNPISIWMKLLRHKKRKNDWINVAANGELAFDTFIGAGCIEIQRGTNPPAILRLDLAKESITPKQVNKQPTIGGAPMAPAMGGIMAAGMGEQPMNGAYAAAGEEMPF